MKWRLLVVVTVLVVAAVLVVVLAGCDGAEAFRLLQQVGR